MTITTPEIWDLYTYDGKLVGKIQKGEEIPPMRYHLTVEVIPTDRKGHILITQRSYTKRRSPGKLEFPAGSVKSGEKPEKAAYRELFEETGLKAKIIYPLQVSKSKFNPKRSGIIRNIYLAYVEDLTNQEVILQEEETISYRFVTVDQWKELMASCDFDPERIPYYSKDLEPLIRDLVGAPPAEPVQPPKTYTFKKRSQRGLL